MMKKMTLLVACLALVAMSNIVSAQGTKVTKQIKTFDWMDVAVVDGNQVEGGLHVYDKWDNVVLKNSEQKAGMLVTITDPAGDASVPTRTYRLKVKGTADAAKLPASYELMDGILVADVAARDLLLTAGAKPAIGTIVGVTADASGEMAAFFYAGGTDWISLGGSSAAGGYIFAGQGTPNVTTGAPGFIGDASGDLVSTIGTVALGAGSESLKISSVAEVTIPLTNISGPAYVVLPKAWNKPTFYLYDGTKEYLLNDCWTVSYLPAINGVEYQQWVATDFTATAGSATLSLIVR